MLVLQAFCQDDEVTRPPSLSQPEASVGEGGSMGRKEPGRCPGVVSQSQVGEAICPFPRTVWCGEGHGGRNG